MLNPDIVDTKMLIADWLRRRFPVLSAKPLEDATPLLAGGVVDSLGILDLAGFLGERLGIEIGDDDFEPGNFGTFGELIGFVERKKS